MIWTSRFGVVLLTTQLCPLAEKSKLFGTEKTPADADVRNQLRVLVSVGLMTHADKIGDGKYRLTKSGTNLLHSYRNKRTVA